MDDGVTRVLRCGDPVLSVSAANGVNENVVPGARVWCLVDTLLTSSTISDALSLAGKRKRPARKAERARP